MIIIYQDEYKTKKYNNNRISLQKNIKTENNYININNINNISSPEKNKNEIKTSHILDFSKENNQNINYNYKTIEKRKVLSNKEREREREREKLINNNKIRNKTCFSENKNRMNYPLNTMNFNQRLQHYTNKKMFDLEKIKKDLINIEEDIYTFYPRTNKIKKDKKTNSEKNIKVRVNIKNKNNSKRKTKLNYQRLNELYLDYKERKARIKKLEKENNIKDGISFNPQFFTNNKKLTKSKSKVKRNNLFLENI